MGDYEIDIDETIESRKDICIDKATVLVAIFRKEGTPAKVVHGYRNGAWHAWAEIFDKKEWTWQWLDPTEGASLKAVYQNNAIY